MTYRSLTVQDSDADIYIAAVDLYAFNRMFAVSGLLIAVETLEEGPLEVLDIQPSRVHDDKALIFTKNLGWDDIEFETLPLIVDLDCRLTVGERQDISINARFEYPFDCAEEDEIFYIHTLEVYSHDDEYTWHLPTVTLYHYARSYREEEGGIVFDRKITWSSSQRTLEEARIYSQLINRGIQIFEHLIEVYDGHKFQSRVIESRARQDRVRNIEGAQREEIRHNLGGMLNKLLKLSKSNLTWKQIDVIKDLGIQVVLCKLELLTVRHPYALSLTQERTIDSMIVKGWLKLDSRASKFIPSDPVQKAFDLLAEQYSEEFDRPIVDIG